MAELDYKAMFDSLFERVQSLLQADEEYFALLTVISEKSKYTDAISKQIFNFKKQDQLKILRLTAQSVLLSEELCLKYGIPLDGDADNIGDET